MRKSNFELLRILAMFMVLILHSYVFPVCDKDIGFFIYHLIWELCVVAVNLFVFISGFFQIKTSVNGFVKYFIVICFYSLILGYLNKHISGPFGSWWFVNVYFQLMLIAPFLNKIIDSLAKREHLYFISSVAILNFFFGFYSCNPGYETGYNLVNFVCIYVTARYLYKYPHCYIMRMNKKTLFFIYFVLCFFNGCMYWIGNGNVNFLNGIAIWYNSPTVFLASMFLFASFVKIKIGSNKTLNWIAVSSFSVYLISNHPYFADNWYPCLWPMVFKYWNHSIYIFIVNMITMNVVIFMVCIIIDKIRMVLTRKIERKIVKIVGCIDALVTRR